MIRSATMMVCALLMLFGPAAGHALAQADAPSASPRMALVIGNGAYATSPLPTAANDAGLVAQTLAAAGFDVTGGRDLGSAALHRAVREFLDKAASGGPRGVAVVYLAGHALQVDGENYFAATDAQFEGAVARPTGTFRIADLVRGLAATNLGAKVVIIDGAYADAPTGPFSTGLALAEPGQGTMLAFNAAPDTAAEIVRSGYGVYATMLTRNMKQGGTSVEEVFDRVRVAVDSETRGSVIPWNVSKLLQSFTFFDRADNAPALASAQIPFTSLRTRPLRDFSAEQAYDVAIARDTLPSYQEYLTVFPDHPLAHRIRRVLAVRREALFWRDALRINSPPALWTYLRRYPKGPHGPEAARRLARLAVGRVPPSDFRPLAFDIPPPADDEAALFQRRVAFDDPDLPPPPPPPLFMLPPSRGGDMGPPPPPEGPGLLPVPPAAMIPFVRPIIAPGVILPPRGLESGYRQPRPFMAGPPGGGIVPRPDGAQQGGEVQRPSATPQMPAMSGSKAAPASPRLPAPPAIPAPVAPHPPVAPAGAAMPVPLQPRQPMEPTVLAPSGQVTVAKQASRRRDDATPRQQHPPQAQVGPQAPSAIRAAPSLGRKPRGREHSAGSPPSGLGPHTPGPSLAPSGESVAPQAGARQHRGRPECGHPDQPPCGR